MTVRVFRDAIHAAVAAAALATGPELCAARTGQAQQYDQVQAYRIPGDDVDPIRVDGLLGEDVWRRAPLLTGFRQREPLEGRSASERTEVRVAYDGGTLYVGVTAYDSEPDRVVARILDRDGVMAARDFGPGLVFGGDDAVAILFDPFHDHRNAVVFATNPNGAQFEALITDEGSEVNVDWRGVWEVAGTRTPDGWSAEFAIPWRTLRYPDAAPDRPWGLNVYRVIRRKNEEVLWQSWRREGGGFHRVSRAGHLTGLDDLPREGLNLEIKPFVLSGLDQEADGPGAIRRSDRYEAGLDLKTEVRPGLLLDVTVNTDFAQVEVDDERVNLTRFDLFFPEKRDFFLENAGVFEFGTPGGSEPPAYQMFFSRQVGIHDDGEVPIIAGARLTGRVGGQTVGFMNVVTEAAWDTPRESFTVARVKRDVGDAGYVGGMVVDRRGSGGRNTAVGVDGQFAIGEAWVWDWYASRTATAGSDRDGYSYRVAYEYSGATWGSLFDHYVVSDGADPRAGFVLRDDIRRTNLFVHRTWRPRGSLGLRDVAVWVGGRHATAASDGRLQDWVGGVALRPVWESGDDFSVYANAAETVVDEAFELSDSVEVPAGRYRGDHIGWFGSTSSSRAVYLGIDGVISRFHGGTLVSAGGSLTANPSPQLSLALGFTRNRVDLPGGQLDANITSLRATHSFSTRLSTNVLVQYNSLDRALATNVRFNYIHRPGSDLFIVFTEGRGGDVGAWNLDARGLVMKVTYLRRL
jgi:hypothetical protein